MVEGSSCRMLFNSSDVSMGPPFDTSAVSECAPFQSSSGSASPGSKLPRSARPQVVRANRGSG